MKLIQNEQSDLLTQHAVPKSNSTLILGVDIGSSGLKAVLLDVERGIRATVSESLALYNENTGWAEADTNEWWQSLCIAIPKLISEANYFVSNSGKKYFLPPLYSFTPGDLSSL